VRARQERGGRRGRRQPMGRATPRLSATGTPDTLVVSYLPSRSRYAANAASVSGSALPGTDSRTASS